MLVIVGRDLADRNPNLAVGPFPTRATAEEFKRHLERTTSGVYVILLIHSPQN